MDEQQNFSDEKKNSESEEDIDVDWPSAPPLDYLEKIKGYEMVSFDSVSVPPPTNTVKNQSDEKEKRKNSIISPETFPAVTQDQAKEALIQHLSTKCCYGKTAVNQMMITKMEYIPAFHYELQTFLEKRETNWTYTAHKGGSIDSTACGSAPLPWEIEEAPSQMFKDEVKIVSVPHTAVVKTCHKCKGTGGMTCKDCSGKGWVRCLHCHGDVYLSDGGSLGRER